MPAKLALTISNRNGQSVIDCGTIPLDQSQGPLLRLRQKTYPPSFPIGGKRTIARVSPGCG